ncbi:3755_t:CDS:2 [Acaulospora morrowiae]|uniref:3755_t:CDS:1 n=1 Tax=Acaulospora morrowiae TaxID=94023 RepID=A0A9N8ZLL8_9GLOM|nr:3755_t:CDS:2 [Acaulospora morrowiae]
MNKSKTRRNATRACNLCCVLRKKCVFHPSSQKCLRCLEKNETCVFTRNGCKRGPKPRRFTALQIPPEPEIISIGPQLLDRMSFNSEFPTENSKFCASCREQEKRCTYNCVPGEFRCEQCKKSKKGCLFQCIKCYKKNNLLSSCTDCKVTKEDPPESQHRIIIDPDTQKPYLQHFNCNHKIEITPTLIDAMTKSYEAGRVTDEAIDHGDSDNAKAQVTDGDSYDTIIKSYEMAGHSNACMTPQLTINDSLIFCDTGLSTLEPDWSNCNSIELFNQTSNEGLSYGKEFINPTSYESETNLETEFTELLQYEFNSNFSFSLSTTDN